MGWKSFWQGLITNVVSTVLILGAGALLTILAATNSKWAKPTLYGLAGIALMAGIVFVFTGRAILSKKQPQTTIDNVETNIRAWSDYFGLGIQKVSEAEAQAQSHFCILVRCRSGVQIIVMRSKSHDRYLAFVSNLDIAEEHRNVLAQLPKVKSARILQELTLEFARHGIGYQLNILPDGTLSRISITKAIPITRNLTEDTFIAYLDQVESGTQVALGTVRMAIEDAKPLT
jgi:hypothetical protein